jgi:hypothetical protein
MKLTRLNVDLCGYGANAGLYEGGVTFENEFGTVKIILDPKLSKRVLGLCAEALVSQAHKTAGLLTTNILEASRPELEARQ